MESPVKTVRPLKRLRCRPPSLTEAQILAWADDHHERWRRWPDMRSGNVLSTLGEKWSAIDSALRQGHRGLPGGISLGRFLADHRNAPFQEQHRTPLTDDQILGWADMHHRRTDGWPTQYCGPVVDAPGEKWGSIDQVLRQGLRGLAGDSSLACLLESRRGVRHHLHLAQLTEEQVLDWADAHHRRTGRWPTKDAGPVADMPNETWARINTALREGLRGFRGRSSLAQLLTKQRGVRNQHALPLLSEARILEWADVHRRRTGRWPSIGTGPVVDAPAESWSALHCALSEGLRGLPGRSSLARQLERHRGVRNIQNLPPLTETQIVAWADAHHKETGMWPTKNSGRIGESLEDTWSAVNAALQVGGRRLSGGLTLARLLARDRSVRKHQRRLPALTV